MLWDGHLFRCGRCARRAQHRRDLSVARRCIIRMQPIEETTRRISIKFFPRWSTQKLH
jgi:hypothetical protein